MCAVDHSLLAEGGGDTGSDIQQKVVVTKCYSAIEASSSPHQIKKLVNDSVFIVSCFVLTTV